MNKDTWHMIERLKSLGITEEDALALRRISMTLHRWHELECGDSNEYGSWCISRGRKDKGGAFEYADDGAPYQERTSHTCSGAAYTRIPDREKGAHKRLAAIMARYPKLSSYVQTDPRGAALYIIERADLEGNRIVEQAQVAGFAYEKAGEKNEYGAPLYQYAQFAVRKLIRKTFECPEQGAVWYLQANGIKPLKSRNLPIDEHYTRGVAVYK